MEDWWYRNWEKITNWWIFEDREKEAGTWKQWAVGTGKWEGSRMIEEAWHWQQITDSDVHREPRTVHVSSSSNQWVSHWFNSLNSLLFYFLWTEEGFLI
jgi:hypothetical protein